MAYSVFISYSTHDLATAARAKEMLERAGAEVYVAEYSLEPGSDVRNEVLSRIRHCDLFLLLWSRHAEESEWVSQEVGAAQGTGRLTIPVLLDDTVKPPGFLRGLKCVPAFRDLARALAWLQENVAARATKKKQGTLALVGLGAFLLWVAAQEKE